MPAGAAGTLMAIRNPVQTSLMATSARLATQATPDAHLVELWLHGRSPHTQRAYRADVGRFLTFVTKPLPTVTLGNLQAFADALAQQDLAASSRVRTLAAVKSLLAFGQRTGYLPLNVGAALKLPPKNDKLARAMANVDRKRPRITDDLSAAAVDRKARGNGHRGRRRVADPCLRSDQGACHKRGGRQAQINKDAWQHLT